MSVTFGRQCESAGVRKKGGFIDELVDLAVGGDDLADVRFSAVCCSRLIQTNTLDYSFYAQKRPVDGDRKGSRPLFPPPNLGLVVNLALVSFDVLIEPADQLFQLLRKIRHRRPV